MLIFTMLEALIMLTIIGILASQIAIPLIKGTKLFPIFRTRRKQLEDELIDLKEEDEVKELQETIDKIKRRN